MSEIYSVLAINFVLLMSALWGHWMLSRELIKSDDQ